MATQSLKVKDADTIQSALDEMGLALAGHSHTWSNELRRLYERATRIVNRARTGTAERSASPGGGEK